MNADEFRVLLISPLPPPAGGISIWSKRFLGWAADNQIAADIVNTAVIGERGMNITAKRNFLDELRRTSAILRNLGTELRTRSPSVAHLNTSCGRFGILRDYLCAIAVSRERVPLVVHYHCNIGDQIRSRFQLSVFRRLTCLADTVLVLNAESRRYVKSTTGRESQTVANFLGDDFIIVHPKNISPEIRNVLFVGHVQMGKGVGTILDVARSLPTVDFVLAGPVSTDVHSLSRPGNVKLLGNVDHDAVRSLLDEADVFLFPSHTEGFSNALLEAMARGVPIITTPVGANADMIEASGGVLVRVGNTADIIAAFDKMRSQEVRVNMSLWNLQKVKNAYSIDVQMHNLLDMYRRTVMAHGSSRTGR